MGAQVLECEARSLELKSRPDRVRRTCDTADALHAGTLLSNPVNAGTRPGGSARETVKFSGIGAEWFWRGSRVRQLMSVQGRSCVSEGAVQLQGCWLLVYTRLAQAEVQFHTGDIGSACSLPNSAVGTALFG